MRRGRTYYLQMIAALAALIAVSAGAQGADEAPGALVPNAPDAEIQPQSDPVAEPATSSPAGEPPAVESSTEPGESTQKPELPVVHSEAEIAVSLRRHYDAGLELRGTQILDGMRPMLHAQWLRHWPSGFKLGGFLSALTSQIKDEVDSVKTRSYFYALGLTVEYNLMGHELEHPSIALGFNLGQGSFSRRTEDGTIKTYKDTTVYVVEPYLAAQVFYWRMLEWGVGAAFRAASTTDADRVNNADVAGASFFVSVRHEI